MDGEKKNSESGSGSESSSEEQGGLLGLIANLSGVKYWENKTKETLLIQIKLQLRIDKKGDEGSDVGAIIGALTGVVTNLFGVTLNSTFYEKFDLILFC